MSSAKSISLEMHVYDVSSVSVRYLHPTGVGMAVLMV